MKGQIVVKGKGKSNRGGSGMNYSTSFWNSHIKGEMVFPMVFSNVLLLKLHWNYFNNCVNFSRGSPKYELFICTQLCIIFTLHSSISDNSSKQTHCQAGQDNIAIAIIGLHPCLSKLIVSEKIPINLEYSENLNILQLLLHFKSALFAKALLETS